MKNNLNRSECEDSNTKPGKNDIFDYCSYSLKMVGPDCDTKRSGPCKSLAPLTDELPKRITDRLAQIRKLALDAYKEKHSGIR